MSTPVDKLLEMSVAHIKKPAFLINSGTSVTHIYGYVNKNLPILMRFVNMPKKEVRFLFRYDRLNLLAKEKGVTKAHICRKLGKTPYYLRDAEKTNINIHGDQLSIIAEILDTTPEYLSGQSDIPYKHKNAPTHGEGALGVDISLEGQHIGVLFDKADEKDKLLTHSILDKYDDVNKITTISTKRKNPGGMIEIDVYDEPAAAGFGNYLDAPQSHREQYPSFLIPKGTDFGIKISGNSMLPTIEDGTIVFVRSSMVVENGKIGIFVLNGEAFCKQLIVDHKKGEVRLHSRNPDYEDIIIKPTDDLRTIGQVL